MSSLDYLDLCRLCLVKDGVSVPIFEGEGDVRQIFLKIAACLPVKVAREDKLPKKICDNCVYKVELLYQFWNTTANAEKQLLQWLGEVGLEDKQGYVTGVLNTSTMKEEDDASSVIQSSIATTTPQSGIGIGVIDNIGLGMPFSGTTHQQQLPPTIPINQPIHQALPGPSNQPAPDQLSQTQGNATTRPQDEEEESSEEEDNSDDDCDADDGLPVKEESEEDLGNSRNIEPTTFVNVSLACDEAGPSGLQQQKNTTEIPELSMPQTLNESDAKSGGDISSNNNKDDEIFGGLSGMLRQILSPSSPECSEPTSSSFLATLSNINEQEQEQQRLQQHIRLCSANTNLVNVHTTANLGPQLDFKSSLPSSSLQSSSSHSCLTCGLEFINRFKLNFHMKTHMEKKYRCVTCGKNFTTQHHLKMHEAMHSDVKPFNCSYCPATFRYQKLLDRHQKMHDPDIAKPYSCPRCLMRFDTRNNYNHHAKTHTSTSRNPTDNVDGNITLLDFDNFLVNNEVSKTPVSFPCEACSKEFPSIDSLATHKLSHRSRPLVCDVCGKAFTHRKYYVVHQRIHTGERPYLCAVCGKSFTQASTLTVHRRYHTGERPYTCTQCGKGFVTRTIMLNHMKKHQ
ncbi:histone-lysine N-methyltransferase PRDM9-like isoform X12 [Athalia rosae]|uniref:histone-lysine N-methyltransferase PRDM9-like isoform X12 n=1 Tax=Athalia rosae TaxID=37344 RepID=UPI0020340C0E|nr:histone-lysine N-methyltransferase PRDM9-like isoform X12 [Athalia rosae]